MSTWEDNDYGWTAHIDKTGTPCAYCGEPSTQTLAVEDDKYQEGQLIRRGKRVGVCDEHNREPEELPASMTFRRRKAKDVEQLGLDVGDGQHVKGPQHAIYGHNR